MSGTRFKALDSGCDRYNWDSRLRNVILLLLPGMVDILRRTSSDTRNFCFPRMDIVKCSSSYISYHDHHNASSRAQSVS